MKIRKEILNRIKKTIPIKVNLHGQFYQNGYEYLTNSYYMIKKQTTEKHQDTPETPIMSIAEKMSAVSEDIESTRVDIRHLIDTLQVLKDNGAIFVDIKTGKLSISLEVNSNSNKITLSAIVMAVNK